jgi:hypothetical protein
MEFALRSVKTLVFVKNNTLIYFAKILNVNVSYKTDMLLDNSSLSVHFVQIKYKRLINEYAFLNVHD